MKANPRLRSSSSPILSVPLAAAALLLASCVPQVAAPPPRQPAPARTSVPAPAPVPAPMPEPAANWRDAPITPGDWQWSMTNPGSTATFADGRFVMTCALPQRTITLMQSATAAAPATMKITTEAGVRALAANPVAGGLAVSLPARDPLLDAMAFSRGRFAVETAGQPPLYIPSWTEISRVIEDCR